MFCNKKLLRDLDSLNSRKHDFSYIQSNAPSHKRVAKTARVFYNKQNEENIWKKWEETDIKAGSLYFVRYFF